MTDKEKVLTHITDRAAISANLAEGFHSTVVPIETARELKEMCEELAAALEYHIAQTRPIDRSGAALARYQAMKEKAK